MTLTPVAPERCGHIAPMVFEPTEGGYAARCLRCGNTGGGRHRHEKRDARCWSWDEGARDSLRLLASFAASMRRIAPSGCHLGRGGHGRRGSYSERRMMELGSLVAWALLSHVLLYSRWAWVQGLGFLIKPWMIVPPIAPVRPLAAQQARTRGMALPISNTSASAGASSRWKAFWHRREKVRSACSCIETIRH